MFYHPQKKVFFTDHNAIRASGLWAMLPSELDDDCLEFLGVVQLASGEPPAEPGKVAIDADPIEVDGVWTRQWQLVDLPDEAPRLPAAIEMLQLKLQLGNDGKLALAESTIMDMEGEPGAVARAYWINAQNAYLENGLVAQLWPLLYASEDEFHQAWISASVLQV